MRQYLSIRAASAITGQSEDSIYGRVKKAHKQIMRRNQDNQVEVLAQNILPDDLTLAVLALMRNVKHDTNSTEN